MTKIPAAARGLGVHAEEYDFFDGALQVLHGQVELTELAPSDGDAVDYAHVVDVAHRGMMLELFENR